MATEAEVMAWAIPIVKGQFINGTLMTNSLVGIEDVDGNWRSDDFPETERVEVLRRAGKRWGKDWDAAYRRLAITSGRHEGKRALVADAVFADGSAASFVWYWRLTITLKGSLRGQPVLISQ